MYQLGFSKETKPIIFVCLFVCLFTYLLIMEAARLCKLENQECWVWMSEKKMDIPAQVEREQIPSSSVFWFYQALNDWMLPAHIDEGNLVYCLQIQMLISSRSSLTYPPRNNVLPTVWSSLCPAKLHVRLTITLANLGLTSMMLLHRKYLYWTLN